MIIFNSLGFWQTRARWLIFLVADSRRLLSFLRRGNSRNISMRSGPPFWSFWPFGEYNILMPNSQTSDDGWHRPDTLQILINDIFRHF